MSVKRIDPNAITKFVSVTDDAIDTDKCDLKDYAKGGDVSVLKFKDGMKPTYFLARPIGIDAQTDISTDHMVIEPGQPSDNKGKPSDSPVAARVRFKDETRMMIRYFRSSILSVEEDGVTKPCAAEEFSPSLVVEIGSYVFLLTQLGPAQKKISAPLPT